MKLAILLIVGGLGLLCLTGYLAYVDFAKSIFSFFRSPQHHRISSAGVPKKEYRFKSRKIVMDNNATDDQKLARRTLAVLNGVRAVIASGRIDAIKDFLDSFEFFKQITVPLGPVANMMRLEWNGTMEQIVKERMNNASFVESFTNLFNTVNFDGYHSFAWIGDINEAIDAIAKKLKLKKFDSAIDQIKSRSELVEYIIALVYLAISYPGTIDIAGRDLGPAAALVATRHQIGCSKSRLKFFSICIVRADGATKLYEKGVTCYNCPKFSSCEWRTQPDNTMMQADMCVLHPNFTSADEDALNAEIKANMTELSSISASVNFSIFLIFCVVFLKNKLI